MPEQLFYRIIFTLQKWQLIQFQQLLDIMCQKQNLQNTTKDEWKEYAKSDKFSNTL